MTTSNKALLALIVLFLLFCGGVVIGLLIYFTMFIIELAAHTLLALPLAIAALIILILKMLALQPK